MATWALNFSPLTSLTISRAFSMGMPAWKVDDLADGPAGGVLDPPVVEGLQGDLPLDQLLFEDLLEALDLEVVVGDQGQLVLFQEDVRPAVLEVETVADLLEGRR